MNRCLARLTALSLLLLAASVSALAATWQIDPAHSAATFVVRHLMISNVRGEFSHVTGTVEFDGKDVRTISVNASIDATTVNTREPQRDTHLKSGDFLDVANYPTITFKSKRVEQVKEGSFKIVGDLTIRGVTKEVVLDVTGPTPEIKFGPNTRIGATASTKINRKDFGVSWNRVLDNGGAVVSDEVIITIDLELVNKPAAPPAASTPKPN